MVGELFSCEQVSRSLLGEAGGLQPYVSGGGAEWSRESEGHVEVVSFYGRPSDDGANFGRVYARTGFKTIESRLVGGTMRLSSCISSVINGVSSLVNCIDSALNCQQGVLRAFRGCFDDC